MAGMVIVGGGQAGYSVASKLRTAGYEGDVTIICSENCLPYQRPPLSKKFLMGEVPKERLLFRPKSFYDENNIKVKLGVTVVKIERIKCEISLSDECKIAYKKLFITTGATPNKFPEVLGGDLRKVYYLRSLEDIESMMIEFKPNNKLLVVGGGYIGLEIAAVAKKKNLSVVLVEAQERILKRVASTHTSDFFRKLHQQHLVRIIEGNSIQKFIEIDGEFLGAILESGEKIDADFAVVGIGVTPNTALASSAGLEINNGIKVDSFCRTSDSNILAAGDCCNFPINSNRLRLESVGNAIEQGEAAAMTALGYNKPYVVRPWFWSDQYDVKLQIAGLSIGYNRTIVRKSKKSVSFWYFRGKKLLAVDAIDDARAYMVAKKLIEHGISPKDSDILDIKTDLKLLIKNL